MLSENLDPWLIEINSSPALGASTPVTEKLCRNVIEDTLKVVLDRRENKQADVGRFELAFRQPYIAPPSYMGCNVFVEGKQIAKPKVAKAPEPKSEPKKSDDEEENPAAVKTNIKTIKSKEACDSAKTMTTKSVPKFVYEKKETQKIDKTRLDGIIEKLSRGANTKETKEKIEMIEKTKSSVVAARIEKQTSTAKHIEKSVSAPKVIDREPREKISIKTHHRGTTGKEELKINVTKPHSEKRIKSDKMEQLRKNAPVVTEWVNVDFSNPDVLAPTISCCPSTKPTQTYTIPSNNINNNTMTISIAEVMDNQNIKPSISTNCGKINRHKSVGKSDSFEPISQQASQLVNCCGVQPNDSMFDVLCPQVGSYDFRMLQQKCQQAYRLKKSKSKHKSKGTSSTKMVANAATRPKQYGILDVEDITGVRQAQGKYRQLFLNSNHKENTKHLRLEPSPIKQEDEEET